MDKRSYKWNSFSSHCYDLNSQDRSAEYHQEVIFLKDPYRSVPSIYSGMSLAELKSVTRSRLNGQNVYVYLKPVGINPSFSSNSSKSSKSSNSSNSSNSPISYSNTQCGNYNYLYEYDTNPRYSNYTQYYAPPHSCSSMSMDLQCVSSLCNTMEQPRNPTRFPYQP